MSDLIERLYERHCQGDDLCGKAQAEIERLKEHSLNLTNELCEAELCEAELEIERLRAVVDAAKDYLWCTADPPTEQMARAKLEKALAALEQNDE